MIADQHELMIDDVMLLRKVNNAIADSKPGSDEYEAAVKAKAEISKEILEREKAILNEEMERTKLEMDAKKIEKERKDEWIKFGVKCGGGIAGTLGGWWFYDKMREKMEKYEKDGIVSSTMFRNLINKVPWIGKK